MIIDVFISRIVWTWKRSVATTRGGPLSRTNRSTLEFTCTNILARAKNYSVETWAAPPLRVIFEVRRLWNSHLFLFPSRIDGRTYPHFYPRAREYTGGWSKSALSTLESPPKYQHELFLPPEWVHPLVKSLQQVSNSRPLVVRGIGYYWAE